MALFPRAWRAMKSLFLSNHIEGEAPAFRIYAFKSGAWPELILGAVMGAAGRIEAERRHTQPTAAAGEIAETARGDAKQGDTVKFNEIDLAPKPKTRPVRDAVNGKFDLDLPMDTQRNSEHRPQKPIDPTLHERFGSYASQAEAELATYRTMDEEAYDDPDAEIKVPANSNAVPADAVHPDDLRSTDIIVPFPTPRPSAKDRPKGLLTDGISPPKETLRQQPVEPGNTPATIGVELRRETATFHVPISQASLPEALTNLAENIRVQGHMASEQPQLELTLPPLSQVSNGAQSPNMSVDHPSFAEELTDFEPPLVLRKIME